MPQNFEHRASASDRDHNGATRENIYDAPSSSSSSRIWPAGPPMRGLVDGSLSIDTRRPRHDVQSLFPSALPLAHSDTRSALHGSDTSRYVLKKDGPISGPVGSFHVHQSGSRDSDDPHHVYHEVLARSVEESVVPQARNGEARPRCSSSPVAPTFQPRLFDRNASRSPSPNTAAMRPMLRQFSATPFPHIPPPPITLSQLAEEPLAPSVFAFQIRRDKWEPVEDLGEGAMPWLYHFEEADDSGDYLPDGGHPSPPGSQDDGQTMAADGISPSSPRRRTRDRIYQCKSCRKWFDRPSALATHMNAHSGDRPFKCPVETCDKWFSVRSNARRHGRTHARASSVPGRVSPSFDTSLAAEPVPVQGDPLSTGAWLTADLSLSASPTIGPAEIQGHGSATDAKDGDVWATAPHSSSSSSSSSSLPNQPFPVSWDPADYGTQRKMSAPSHSAWGTSLSYALVPRS